MSENLTEQTSTFFSKTSERAIWLVLAGALAGGWLAPFADAEKTQLYGLILCAGIFSYLRFHWFIPRFGNREWIVNLGMTVNVLLVTWAVYLFGRIGANVDMVYMLIVVHAGIIGGWKLAWRIALLAGLGDALVQALLQGVTFRLVLTEVFHIGLFVIAGYTTSTLATTIRRQNEQIAHRHHDQALLLSVSVTLASSMETRAALPRLAEQIARGIPATFCRICLLDDASKQFVTAGVFPLRVLDGLAAGLGSVCALADAPQHARALAGKKPVILRLDGAAVGLSAKERAALLFTGAQTACIAPIFAAGKPLGTLTLGEARRWSREPFDADKTELLENLAAQIALGIQNAESYQTAHKQAERVGVLNEVARAVGSTIEMDELLEQVHAQLSRVIHAETYYVSLYDAAEDTVEVRVLIDDGQRFPPAIVPIGDGLVSWVVKRRAPLLIRDSTSELPALGIRPLILGRSKMSRSWLGVPLAVGAELLGTLAVASYEPNQFDAEDVDLLSNIAEQVALALDNARHHAQVEEQARRDSLTGAYNHGYLLARLREEVLCADGNGDNVSLIMLDIDYFKQYNDRYGHVVGDAVLRRTAQTIQSHVKKTDVVGRWGGEEFAVALVGTTPDQARRIADRIRETMAQSSLLDARGIAIPAPTVSQGIATFPIHVPDADALVVVADRALYFAKESGRDQVRVADG